MAVLTHIRFKQLFSRKGIANLFWIIFGVGMIVLLSAAIKRQNQQVCSGVSVELDKNFEDAFIDEKDVIALLNTNGKITQHSLQSIYLKSFEMLVEKNAWVKNAALYFDNKNILHVKIKERTPVAMVLGNNEDAFYIDSAAMRLPQSDKFAVRVPVFTGYPGSMSAKISKPDSLLLRQMVRMASFIQADSFWMAQIEQINIQSNAEFELVPMVGSHLINFGTADSLEKKFNNLYAFYQQIFTRTSINAYKTIDLRFNNQVVAVKSEYKNNGLDSVKAKQDAAISWMSDTAVVQHNLPVQNSVNKTNNLPVEKEQQKVQKQINFKQNKINNHTLSDNQKLGLKTNSNKNKKAPKAVMKKQN